MFGKLLLLFTVVPLVELLLLIKIGDWMGFWPTLFLVVSTGAVGVILARAQGLTVVGKIRRELALGRLPGNAMLDGFLVFIGATLLLTPGVITDSAGFFLLFPATRKLVRETLKYWLLSRLRHRVVRFDLRH